MSGFKFKGIDFDNIFKGGSSTTSTGYIASNGVDIGLRYCTLTSTTNYPIVTRDLSYYKIGASITTSFSPYYNDYSAGGTVDFGDYNEIQCIIIGGGSRC